MDSLVSFSLMIIISSTFFILNLIDGAKGTLTPGGTVSLYCDSQQTFTCSVTGVAAVWTISGLSGISVTRTSGQIAANNNPRITTTDSGVTQSSTITITRFTTSDDGGTIQCINLEDGSVQGMANISVELPSCPEGFSANRDGDFTSATVTYQLEPVVSTTVTYCPTSSPNCGDRVTCPSTGTCTISGLDPCMVYNVSAILNDNCESATECTENSMVVAAKELPSCPTSFSANRDGDFTSATVTYQLATPPPVTSTTVTYCPTSSPNCGNSMNCTTSPCTIRGLDPCVEYNLLATATNNCGSPTGCTGNSMVVDSQGVPSCPSSLVAVAHDDNDAITVTWQQPPNTPPVTSTTVTYCPTSSPNCGNSMNCTSPCNISGLNPGTEYQFTVIPNNKCGSTTGHGCTGNTATAHTACICPICTSQPSPVVEVPLLAGILPTVVLLLANVVTGVVVFLITRHYYKKTSQKSSPSKGEDVYEQVEGPMTYEDIVMTDSPAYGPVK